MKKKFLFIAGLSLSLIVPFALANNASSVQAAFEENEEYSDNFNNVKLNSVWESNNANIRADYYSLRIIPDGQDWGANLIYSNYKVDKSVSLVEVSFEMQELQYGGWLGFAAGQPSTKTPFSSGSYGFIFSDGGTQYFKPSGAAGLKEDTTPEGSPSTFSPIYSVYEKRNVSMTFARQNDNTFKCDYVVKDANGNLIGSKLNISTASIDGYFSFNAYSNHSELLSFKIRDDSEEKGVLKLVCDEDFSKSGILYPSSGSAEAHWYATSFTEKDVSCGLIGKASIEKNDSSLVYKTKFTNPNNKKLDLLYSLNATFYLGEMSSTAKSGFEISKSSISDAGKFFGVEKEATGYYLLAPKGDSYEKVKVVFGEDNIDFSINLNCSVYYDGSVIISDGSTSLSSTVNVVDGYFALRTLNSNDDKLVGAVVDDFSYIVSKYSERTTADSAQSFAGTKESRDEYGLNYEFFISSHDWHIGTQVRIPNYTKTSAKEPYILFSSSSITSAFGPKLKYKDFVAKFDATIQTDCDSSSIGSVIGLQVGKKTLEMNYANAMSMGIAYYNGTCLPVGTQVAYDQNRAAELSNPAYLKKGVVLNFVFVVRDNILEMHYKTGDQPESELAEPKMTAYCDNTDGYVAVYGANGLSFKLTKLSITNLDYDVTNSEYCGTKYVETIRHNFATSVNTDGLTLNNASVINNKLRITEDGSVKTNGKLDGNIVRFKVDSIENELILKQGDLKITLKDAQEKKIIITSGANTKEISLGNKFVFANSIFDIEHAGTKLKLKYVSGDMPLARIDKNVVNIDEFIEIFNQNAEIELISKNGVSSLKEISVFNIDSHVTIKARDYNPDVDYFNPWVERESASGGCGGSLIASSIIVTLISVIAVTLVIAKKRGLKNEK